MGRALQRLSAELYSRDTHFVLELVQNADDNKYPEGVHAFACMCVCACACVSVCAWEAAHPIGYPCPCAFVPTLDHF